MTNNDLEPDARRRRPRNPSSSPVAWTRSWTTWPTTASPATSTPTTTPRSTTRCPTRSPSPTTSRRPPRARRTTRSPGRTSDDEGGPDAGQDGRGRLGGAAGLSVPATARCPRSSCRAWTAACRHSPLTTRDPTAAPLHGAPRPAGSAAGQPRARGAATASRPSSTAAEDLTPRKPHRPLAGHGGIEVALEVPVALLGGVVEEAAVELDQPLSVARRRGRPCRSWSRTGAGAAAGGSRVAARRA